MHITYFHYLLDGDTALTHVRQFSEAVESMGHQIDVVGLNLDFGSDSGLGESSIGVKAGHALKQRFRRYLHEPKELIWNLVYGCQELRVLSSNRPDIVVSRDHLYGISSIVAAKTRNLPVILEKNAPVVESRLFHDEYVHLPRVPEWLERWKLRNSDATTVVSGALKQYLSQSYVVDENKILVVPNGADTARFHPDLALDDAIPASFREATVIGFVGSFELWHHPELLTRLASTIGETRPGTRFLFVGRSSGVELLENLKSQLGDRLSLTGQVPHDRVPGLVAGFDIAVLPETAFYCSPLKIFEYMAAGKAVVAPAYGPVEEVIQHEKHGLLFEPGDEKGLREGVLRLIDSPDLRIELGSAAAERIRSQFTWNHNARSVISAAMELVKNGRGR